VTKAQLRQLLEPPVEGCELSFVSQFPNGRYLLVRCPARADEVRVICVREAIRSRASRGDHSVLVESEHEVTRAGFREHVRDRLSALCVRHRMATAVQHLQRSERSKELGALDRGSADLEVR
jgi:hypothetical protein